MDPYTRAPVTPLTIADKQSELRLFFCVRADLNLTRSELAIAAMRGTWRVLMQGRQMPYANTFVYETVPQAKIAKRVKHLLHLERVHQAAVAAGIPSVVIDVAPGVPGLVAIGPASLNDLPKFIVQQHLLPDTAPEGASVFVPAPLYLDPTAPLVVLVERTDIAIPYGKFAAQAGHGVWRSAAPVLDAPGFLGMAWEAAGMPIRVLEVASLDALQAVHMAATNRQIPASFIIDAGRTAFGYVPTPTVVGLGPARLADLVHVCPQLMEAHPVGHTLGGTCS